MEMSITQTIIQSSLNKKNNAFACNFFDIADKEMSKDIVLMKK